MGHTNETANVELSQFLGTDKPAWLVDYNGDMAKIDAYAYATKVKADANESAITSLGNRVTTVENNITNTITPALTNAQNNITTLQGNITTINSLIGNGTPTTTDQTIIGAINEINAVVTAHEFGATVNLASYNSAANAYTFPSDGYVTEAIDNTSSSASFLVLNDDDTTALTFSFANASGSQQLYVKKGMRGYVADITGSAAVRFKPLTNS